MNFSKVMIISGGENCLSLFPKDFFTQFDFIVACDKGFDYAIEADLKPNLILGDFDSCDDVKKIEDSGFIYKKFPKFKDDTDTMLAVKEALSHNPKEIHIFCGLGNRLDHTISNIQTAKYIAENQCKATIYGRKDVFYAFSNSEILVPYKKDFSISVFSLSDESKGVSISGTEYCGKEITLKNSFPLGQSNEWENDKTPAKISVEKGILLVVLSNLRNPE